MITRDLRFYDYFTLGEKDAYGQVKLPKISDTPKGQIKMTINISSQSIQDNILYENCSYVGLTQEPINDTYVINYEGKLLKTLYINPKGRYTQVFMGDLTNG